MPNYCSNTLFVRGKKEDLEKFKKKAYKKFEKEIEGEAKDTALSFENFFPCPDELLKRTAPFRTEEGEDEQEAKRIQFGFWAKYGKGIDTWYDWKVKNWGTKWDTIAYLNEQKNDDELIYSFDTAWAPPLTFIEKVSKLYPKLDFMIDYIEEGEGFEGNATAKNGVLTNECNEIEYEECPHCGENFPVGQECWNCCN